MIARFPVKMPKEGEKHPADVYEFLRFFGITMSQEQLIEKKDGRSLYKIFQKNVLGEKSEFHELRWQDGNYFIVAGVLNSSAASLSSLKSLPQNPWAGRKTASAETEAGVCPTCESSKFMRPIDDWVKSAREWVAVDCQADKVDGKVTGGKILSAVGSCLRGVALSVVDIAKLVYDLLSTQVKFYSDPHYAVAFTRVIWEAVKNPGAFTQNLFSMFWQAAKDTYGKFKGCNIDYQTGLVCQLLVDFLVPGGAIVKGIKLTARGARGAVGAAGALRAAATAEAKVIAEAAPKVAAKTAADEVALSVRTTSEGLEYTATAGGKEAARVTSDELATHLDDMATPTDDILKAEVGAADELRDLASAVSDQIVPSKFSSRRREIEETLRELMRKESAPGVVRTAEETAEKTNHLAKLLVEEMKSKGVKAKIVYSRDLLAKDAREIIEAKMSGVEKNIAGYRQDLQGLSGFRKARLQEALDKAKSNLAKLKAELKDLDAPNVAVRIEVDMASTNVLKMAKEKAGVGEIVIPLERLHKADGIAGYMQVSTHQVGLVADNILNPEGVVSGVLYHEIHHSAKEALVEKANVLIRKTIEGEDGVAAAKKLIPSQEYPFLGTARSTTPGQTVTSFQGYTTYFASDEVPAYARSLAYAMRGLENTTRVTERAVLRTPSDLKAFDVAGKLKNAAQSNLDLVKLMQDHLRTRGMAEVHVIPGSANQVPTVVMPLYRGKVQVGEYTFHPLALQKEFRMSSQKIVEDFLSRMEAASRAHLREAERVLALKPADLKKEIEALTQRSRNARSRRAPPTESVREVEK